MPKIPIKQIDFGGEKFTVEAVDNLKLSGEIKYSQYTIELDTTECIERQTLTLIHECVHYYLIAHGYQKHIPKELCEGMIDTIALGVITLIKRNPKLVRLIQEQV